MAPLLFPLVLAIASAIHVAMPPPMAVAQRAPAQLAVPLGDIAQRAAHVALRTAGLTEGDAEVDRMAQRARLSALLPEFRVRAQGTSAGTRDYVSDTGALETSYFGPSGLIEGSLTFHFDRLGYSGQEARLERLRLERIEARSRITQRVIDEIARWSKATAEERDSPEGTETRADATARRVAAQMALDVWTAGWFSSTLEGRE
jgi:hypothetical protein